MSNNIVDLSGKSRPPTSPPVSDFWFAQVDNRLSRIEVMVTRLEWQIWLVVCGCACLLVIQVLRVLSGGVQ